MAADEELEKEKSSFAKFVQGMRKNLAENAKDMIDAGETYGEQMRKRNEDLKKARAFEKESGRKVVKSESSGKWSFAGKDGKATTEMVGKDDIKNIEGKREEESRWDKLTGMVNGILESNKKQDDILSKMLDKAKDKVGGMLALLAAPIVAVIAFFSEIAKQIKGIGLGGKMVKPFITFFKGLIKFSAKTLILPLKLLDQVLGSFTKGKLKPFKLFLEGVNKVLTRIGNFLKPIGPAIDDLINFFRGATGKILEKFPKTVAAITKFFKGFSDIVKTLVGMGKSLATASSLGAKVLSFAAKFGSILGKLFLPFTIIMGIWDTVKGAIEGFNTTEGGLVNKIIGAITGGIGGLVNSIVGIPLDLLKDGVAWLLKKMGFDETAEALSSFSFVDIFNKIFDSIKETVNGIIDSFVDGIKLLLKGDVAGGFKKIFGGLVKVITAPFTMIMKTLEKVFDFDFKSLLKDTLSFLPDSLLNVIGLGGESDPQAEAAEAERVKRANEKGEFNKAEYDLQESIDRQQADVDVVSKGVFGIGAESKAEQEEDRRKLESLQLQLAELRAEREMQLSVGSQVGGGVVVNNDNRDQSQGKGALNNSGNIADRHGTKSGTSRR